MRKGGKHIRQLMAQLDGVGVTVNINRVCAKRYELQVNFENVGLFRQRSTCNKRVLKLHKHHFSPKELTEQ